MHSKKARDFAKQVEEGCTYWYVVKLKGGAYDGNRRVAAITFTRKALVGLVSVGRTPAGAWDRLGPLYADRNHPAIRDLKTHDEFAREGQAYEDRLLGSADWGNELDIAAGSTRFYRRNW